jgi:hypothetical protein
MKNVPTDVLRPLTNPVWQRYVSLFKKLRMLETKRGKGRAYSYVSDALADAQVTTQTGLF